MVPICMDVLDCYSEDQKIKYFSLYTVDYRHLNRSKRKISPSSIISVYNGVLPSPFAGSTLVELHLEPSSGPTPIQPPLEPTAGPTYY